MARFLYKCKKCGHEQEEYHSMKDAGDLLFVSTLICDACFLQGEMQQIISGGHGFQKVASMTPEQRKEVLKKRSHDHFQKHIVESFHEKNKPGYIP
jgi:hypothetical protein